MESLLPPHLFSHELLELGAVGAAARQRVNLLLQLTQDERGAPPGVCVCNCHRGRGSICVSAHPNLPFKSPACKALGTQPLRKGRLQREINSQSVSQSISRLVSQINSCTPTPPPPEVDLGECGISVEVVPHIQDVITLDTQRLLNHARTVGGNCR